MTLPDEKIVCIYCFHDGYPDHLGQILAKHYDNEEKIKDLMKGGHLEWIESEPSMCGYTHKGSDPLPEDCRPVTRRNLGDFIQKVRAYGQDYGYIFRDGQWHVYNPYE
ncbi:hypothetical protein KML24007_03930 [Alistipes indistinctus]|uniref:hypothetical protein n=1 Tax=Alistipes indistinctus TaxID=626932 RepID=UPI0036F2075C